MTAKPTQPTKAATKQAAVQVKDAKAKARSAAAKKAAKTRAKNKAAKAKAAAQDQRDDQGRFLPGNTPATSFADRPEDRHNGRWRKEDSVSFQYHRFLAMTAAEFKNWRDKNPAETRTMAEDIAYSRVWDARNSKSKALENSREITDRTEGKPAIIAHVTTTPDEQLPTPEEIELKTARLIARRKQLNAIRSQD